MIIKRVGICQPKEKKKSKKILRICMSDTVWDDIKYEFTKGGGLGSFDDIYLNPSDRLMLT